MLALVRTLPEQLSWAAALEPDGLAAPIPRDATAAVVFGVGGSAIAGDVAALVAAAAGRRVTVHRGFGAPPWIDRELCLVVSHSGGTAEALSGFDAARSRVVAISTGGALVDRARARGTPVVVPPPMPQPRAAVGHLAGAALRVLGWAGLIPDPGPALREAADVVQAQLDGPGAAIADEIAQALVGRVAGIYGATGVPAVAAMRLKAQINENAKSPAWFSQLPELLHNEIAGWTAQPRLAEAIGLVLFRDPEAAPEVVARDLALVDTLAGLGLAPRVVAPVGRSPLARLFSLIAIGDLASVALAERLGTDPTPVSVIAGLKSRLG